MVILSFFAYPLDLIYIRLAADIGTGSNAEFTGVIDCAKKLWNEGGISSFHQGFSIMVIMLFLRQFLQEGILNILLKARSLDNNF